MAKITAAPPATVSADTATSRAGDGDRPASLFDEALDAYQGGAAAADVLPSFEQICTHNPRHGAAWTCLCWLQLLSNQPLAALKSGRQAVRLGPEDPQARLNLSLALLETNTTGVRDHIQAVRKVLALSPQLADDLRTSISDGMARRSDWQALAKVNHWLFG